MAADARLALRRTRISVPRVTASAVLVLGSAVESRQRSDRVTGRARSQDLALGAVRPMAAGAALLRSSMRRAGFIRVAPAARLDAGSAGVRLVAAPTILVPAWSRRVLRRVAAPARRRLGSRVRFVATSAARVPGARGRVLFGVATPAFGGRRFRSVRQAGVAARTVAMPAIRAGLLDAQRVAVGTERTHAERELKLVRLVAALARQIPVCRVTAGIHRDGRVAPAASAGGFTRARARVRVVASEARSLRAELGMLRVHVAVATRASGYGATANVVS